MFLNIQIDLLILKTYYGQFTLTTKKSVHVIFKPRKFVSTDWLVGWLVGWLTYDIDDAGKTQSNANGQRLGRVVDRSYQFIVRTRRQLVVIQPLRVRLGSPGLFRRWRHQRQTRDRGDDATTHRYSIARRTVSGRVPERRYVCAEDRIWPSYRVR